MRPKTVPQLLLVAVCVVAYWSAGRAEVNARVSDASWLQHGGGPTATRFSTLTGISRENIGRLRVAWVADLGFNGRLQGSPSVWGQFLFVSTDSGVSAFDARDGTPLWSYSERTGSRTSSGLPIQAPRGSPVILPSSTSEAVVFAALPDSPVVVALDAVSGELRWRHDVGHSDFAESLRTNPLLAGELLIVGPTGADFSPVPGRLVALRATDGAVRWSFDLVPVDPEDPVRDTWAPYPPGRSYGVGGGSAWNAGAYDPVTDVVIFGTGEPIPIDQLDPRRFDGGGRPSPDLYTSSFVALQASNGTLQWFHQVVPGDEWGFDQHTVPIITELNVAGDERRVVLLATTTGFVLVADVVTGQVYRAHKLMSGGNVHLDYDEAGLSILDEALRRTSPDQIVRVCPGTRWASIAPGAYSPVTGLLYRPNDTICIRQGSPSAPDDWQPGGRPTWLLAQVREPEDFFARWGALSAIDPLTGTVAWSFELPYPHDAGVLVTSGGLVFSAFADRQFRAFDAFTGEVLWTQALNAHSDSAPITYEVDGLQYLAVMAGRDTPVDSLPVSGLPGSIAGPATLFVFTLTPAD